MKKKYKGMSKIFILILIVIILIISAVAFGYSGGDASDNIQSSIKIKTRSAIDEGSELVMDKVIDGGKEVVGEKLVETGERMLEK